MATHTCEWSRALDAVIDSLERRYERRIKAMKRIEDAMVAIRRAGRTVDPRMSASYDWEHAKALQISAADLLDRMIAMRQPPSPTPSPADQEGA